MKQSYKLPFLFLFIFVITCSDDSDDKEENVVYSDIVGVIKEIGTGFPIENISVNIVEEGIIKSTNIHGIFRMDSVSSSVLNLIFTSFHHASDSIQVSLPMEDTIFIELGLKSQFSWSVSGNLVLENQSEHSNALIFISGPYLGVGSDSSGNYQLNMWDARSDYHGPAKVYYKLQDYKLDSANLFIDSGYVKLDTLDVDNNGQLPFIELSQFLRVESWTDTSIFSPGDSIHYYMKFSNLTNEELKVSVPMPGVSRSNYAPIFLYSDSSQTFWCTFPYFNFFGLSEDVMDIAPNESFTISFIELVLDTCRFGNRIFPIEIDEYVVTMEFNTRPHSWFLLPNELNEFIKFDWFEMYLHRGLSPQFYRFPNKFELGHIQIVE